MKKKNLNVKQKNRNHIHEEPDAFTRAAGLIDALYNGGGSDAVRSGMVEWFRSGDSEEAKYEAFEKAMYRYLQPNEHPDQADAEEFRQLIAILGLEEQAAKFPLRSKAKRKLNPVRIAMSVAAVLVPVVFIAGAYLWYKGSERPDEFPRQFTAVHHVSVPENEHYRLTLADGTEVVLNEASQFSYDNERGCELRGEAYFRVAKSDKPFIVHTGRLDVTVLGTEFNLSAYGESGLSTVTLYSGSVKIDYEKGSRKLAPGMEFTYDSENRSGSLTMIDLKDGTNLPSWIEDKELFRVQPLGDIFSDIESVYGITIINRNAADTAKLYSFRFVETDPLEVVVSALRDACGEFTYRIHENTITLEKTKK